MQGAKQIYRFIISSIVNPKLFFGLFRFLLVLFGVCSAAVTDAVGSFWDKSSIGATVECVLSELAADA